MKNKNLDSFFKDTFSIINLSFFVLTFSIAWSVAGLENDISLTYSITQHARDRKYATGDYNVRSHRNDISLLFAI